jgi:hypothetical protein
MNQYSQNMIKQLADKLKSEGYRVFIAERGTYGFYTLDGDKVVSFQRDLGSIKFLGNHVSSKSGTGWRFDDDMTFSTMLAASTPRWAITSGDTVRPTSMAQHLKIYGPSSKYTEYLPDLPAYKVTLDDNSSYITSMAAGITLDKAREYFIGQVQVDENLETGAETYRTVVSVEQVTA